MAQAFGKIKSISMVPGADLCSVDQIDIQTLGRALRKKSSYKAYKTLLHHRGVLQNLKSKADLKVQQAVAALQKSFAECGKTHALASACHDSITSSRAVTCPPVALAALTTIMDAQKLYQSQRQAALVECGFERGQVLGWLQMLNERVDKVEAALVKKYGIRTVDDDGNAVDMTDMERVIDVMASIPGIEDMAEE